MIQAHILQNAILAFLTIRNCQNIKVMIIVDYLRGRAHQDLRTRQKII